MHFLNKILIGIIHPFKVLTFNLEGESIVLFNGPVLDFIELIKLSLENIEVTTLLCIKINILILISLKSINYFVELGLGQEVGVVFDNDSLLDLFSWHKKSFLVKVILKRLL